MKNKIISILFSFLTVIALFLFYRHFSDNLAISYYDEEWWIRDSYFFQFYTERNFDRNIWDSASSKDQPMLTRFVFGAWLYPEYLKAKQNDDTLNYSKFLISNGFYFTVRSPQNTTFIKSPSNSFITLPIGSSGFPDDLVKIYGEGINNNIHLIQKVRELTLLLLIVAVIVPAFFIKKQKGLLFALTFLFFYAFNTLIVGSGLMAQTEALFLLTFNSSLIFMFMYYLDNKKFKYLLIFSVMAGLCFSTKLNGIMLLFILIALEVKRLIFSKRNKYVVKALKNIAVAFLITVSIFTLLNPFVYSNPIGRILEMFNHRQGVVNIQMRIFPEYAINKIGDRYLYIAQSFFGNKHILEFNNIKFNSTINILRPILLIMFILGIYLEIKRAKNGNKFSNFILITFLVVVLTTGAYLQLSWNRYLIHLVLFFIYYQIVGLFFGLRKISNCIK